MATVFIFLSVVTGVWANANDEPQELPKPQIRTTPPLYKEWRFDKDALGAHPVGFQSGAVNGQADGQWVVTEEATAPTKSQAVLQQADCSDDSCYSILLGDETDVAYVDVSVRLKLPTSDTMGKAGIVLGAKDEKNFYAAVVTPDTKTIEAFIVRDGKATSFGKAQIKHAKQDWHHLRVQRSPMMSHDLFNVYFDQHMLLSLSDSTFKEGKVGLITWGKGDYSFDNLRAIEYVTNLPLSRPPAY
ncbi:MAG: hypothetical protein KC594_12250 [Nitrospira sp.]|nr:hypothetical protein [Nitrospira sp.]